MEGYTWSYHETDELWQHDIFDSKEDCIADAKENYSCKAGETIAIGKPKAFVPSVDAESVLEALEEQAYEECGDASDGWLDYPRQAIDNLSDRLTKCVNDWLKETKQEPSFYTITDIETIEI
jgi:hypothetical protein